MDPLQKRSSTLISASSPMTSGETSQEVTAASHPSFSEPLMMGLSDLNPSPGTTYPASLAEGLLQQRYRDEKTWRERQWERSVSPQRKKTFLRHVRRDLDHVAPYRVQKEASISSSGDRDQNQFRCECRYCQGLRPKVCGMPAQIMGPHILPPGKPHTQPQWLDPQPGYQSARPSTRRTAAAAGRGGAPTGEEAGKQKNVSEAPKTGVKRKLTISPHVTEIWTDSTRTLVLQGAGRGFLLGIKQ